MTSYQIFLLDGMDKFLVMDTRLPTGPRVGSPEIVDEPNCASVLSFDITVDHPLYRSLTVKTTWLEVYETGVKDPERFRILDADPGDDGVTSVKCEAVMAVFNDTIQPHWDHTGSPAALIDRILANHNAQALRPDGTPDPMRQVRRGVVSSDLDPNNLIVRSVDAWPYPSTMDILKRSTCDSSTGGHLRVRTADGVTYLDWLSTGALSEQVIRWGGTLQQWQCAMSGATILTACEPVGAQIDDEDGTPTDERVILTAADGADLLYTDSEGVAHYGIINPDAYAVYGLVVGSNTWDDVRTSQVLKARAAEYAQTNSLTQVTITASIVDQHLINPEVAQLTVNDRARIIVPILGMADQVMTVARRRRSLVDASGWSVELGAKQATLMDAISQGTRTADQVIQIATSTARLNERMVSVSSSQAEIQAVLTTTREAVAAAEARSVEDRKVLEAAQRDADQAALDAAEAMRQAAMAAGVVEGKVEFWTDPVTPPVEYRRSTVLWIDVSVKGTVLRRWDGESWIVIRDPSAVEAAVLAEAAEDKANASAQAAQAAQAEAEASSATAEAARQASAAAQASAQASASSASEASSLASSAQQAAADAKTASSKATSDAATAQRAADQAAQDAADAAGLANGKSDVVIQLDPPGTALRKATTLWIDTTGNANTPKKWSGSAWVAVTDKTATDAAAAAVAAQTSATKAQSTAEAAKGLADSAQASADLAQSYASSAGMSGANLVVDPSFEDPTVWAGRVGNSGLVVDTSDAHSGSKCGKLPAGTNKRQLRVTSAPIPVLAGQVWRIKAWFRNSSDVAGGSVDYTKIRLSDAEKDVFLDAVATTTVGTSWTHMGWDGWIVPAGVTRLNVHIWTDFTKGTQWVDDLEVVNITDSYTAQMVADQAQARADVLASATFDSAPDTMKPGQFLRAVYLNQKKSGGTYVPTYKDILGLRPDRVTTIPEAALTGSAADWNLGDYYVALVRGIVTVSTTTTLGFTWTQDDTCRIYIDGVSVATSAQCGVTGTVSTPLTVGTHIVDFLLYEHGGSDGIRSLTPTITSQVESLYPPLRVTLASEGAATALLDAQAAQVTADTAKSNAATAQATADQAKILAGEAGRTGANRVTNPGAEADFDGWVKGGTIANVSIAADRKHAGAKSFKFVGKCELTQPEFAVTPGQTWRFALWYWADGTGSLSGGLRLQKRSQDDTAFSDAMSRNVSPSTGWVELTIDYTVPSTGVSHLRPRIAFDLAAGQSVWVDDVCLKDITDVVALQAAADAAKAHAKAALASAPNLLSDPQFVTGADGVKSVTLNASDATAGSLPGGATSYGKLTGNDNWTQNVLLDVTPGRTYRIEVDAKLIKASASNSSFGVFWWKLTADGAPNQEYSGYTVPEQPTTDTWVRMWRDWTCPTTWTKWRPAIRGADGTLLVTNFKVTDVTDIKVLEAAAAAAQARADEAKAIADQAKLDAANIAVTVETVQSNISQLPNQILTEVDSKYVSTTLAQKTTEILRSEMSQTATGIDVRIKQTNETVTSVSGAVVAEQAAREALIRMGVNGVEVGASDSPAKSVYGADGMKILVNGVEVANYKSTGAENSQMLIRDRLQIGNRIIEPNPNGGLWIRGA